MIHGARPFGYGSLPDYTIWHGATAAGAILYADADKKISDEGTVFYYDAATNTLYVPFLASTVAITGLTEGRVVRVGAGGVLADDAEFTYNATTNQLSVAPDADTTHTFGRAKLYAQQADGMGLAHFDFATAAGFAIAQTNTGLTQVNAASGQALHFGIGGGSKWFVSAAGNFVAGTDATNDIGQTGANRPRDLWTSRDASIGGDVSAAGGFRRDIGPWVQDNVAASQAAVVIGRCQTNNPQTRWVARRAGSITGLSAWFSAALSAGASPAFRAVVYKNGTAIAAAKIDVENGSQKGQVTFAKDAHTFAAGDDLEIRITTDAAFAPTTTDVAVDVEIEE